MNMGLAPVNVDDLRRQARRRLPRFLWDYLEGAAEDGRSAARNRAAFDEYRWLPRVLNDVAQRDLSTTLLGAPVSLPLVIGPTGLAGWCWPYGDLAMARAAAQAGIVFALSSASTFPIERLPDEAGGRLWFQLYVFRDRALSERLMGRARDSGYEALVLTCDLPLQGKRERDWRNGLRSSARPTLAALLEVLLHPRWLLGMAGARPRFVNVARELPADVDAAHYIAAQTDPALNWDDFQHLRERWPRKLILKGVLHPEDAERAVALGADALILSNHGGRQLDGAVSALDVLPQVRRAIGQRAEILIDGGVRRGADILKARALGADAVIAGRAPLYGLAAAGEAGVSAVIELLRDEADRTMALLGCCGVRELAAEFVSVR
ncbi:MAG: alpha-hydroxy acid oxidase [Xanthomonadaceae bacterium]|nr:alpha-hydroxy acid oxidase [Xanthomonadaceae bacterium]